MCDILCIFLLLYFISCRKKKELTILNIDFTRLVTFDLSYLLLVNVYTFLVNLSSVLHQMLVPKIAEMANKGDPEVNFFLCRPTMVGGV